MTNLPPAQRAIAMVFQSYALFPHLSVAENILFGLRVRKVPSDQRDAAPRTRRRAARTADAAAAQAGAALRRPAAARRAGTRDHRRGAGVPDGRAAVEPRRAASCRNAPRDPRAAAQARHHHGLRDARSGRGDVDGRSGRPDARGAHRAERHAGRSVRKSRQHLRRALHRHAADEPARARMPHQAAR